MNVRSLDRDLRFSVLFLACIVSLAGAARGDPPPSTPTAGWRIGEKAPVPDSLTWIRRATTEKPQKEQLTVLTFWASWDPVSQIIVARQDSIAARHPNRVRVLAISVDPTALTRRFLKGAGAPFATSPRVEIACDPHGRLFERVHRSVVEDVFFSLPLTVLVREDGTVLWTGFPVQTKSPHPTAVFDAVLDQILTGSYSLDAARAAMDREEKAQRLLKEIGESHGAHQLARTDGLLSCLEQVGIPEGARRNAVSVINRIAWELATRQGRTEQELTLAQRAYRLAWDAGGSEDAPFVDTCARVLFESGRIAEAVAMQEKAADLAKAAPDRSDYVRTLTRYRQALGSQPREASGASATARPPAPPACWWGSLSEALAADSAVLVIPASIGTAGDSLWASELRWITDRTGRPLRRAGELSNADLSTRTLILYGTPRDNSLTKRVLDAHDIAIDSTGIRFGARHVPARDPFLITALSSPWNPKLPVVVYTAARPEQAHGLNGVFHGPTQLVLGSIYGKDRRVIASSDYDSVPPPDSGAAVFTIPQEAINQRPAQWSGTLNDAVTRFDKDREVFRVRPAASGDPKDDSLWTEEMARLSARFGGGVHTADEVPLDARGGKVLILYGNAGTNSLTRDVLDAYGIRLNAEGVRFGDHLIAAPNPILITALPSPWDAAYPVILYASFRSEDAHGLNRVFHGPTQGVVAKRQDDGKLGEVASFDYREVGSGRAIPDLPAPELTAAEAIEDLHSLSDMLATGYAGFGDLETRLRASGSSWSERVASFDARIRGRDRWPWGEFVSLVQDLLGPVQDTHFVLDAVGPSEDGSFKTVRGQFIHGVRPFLTGLSVERTTKGLHVASAPDTLASLIGSEPIGLAPIGDPYEIETGVAYLFPTLPGETGAERFLVGVMAVAPDTPADVLVRFGPGARETRLKLHRGRMRESALYSDAEQSVGGGCPATARPGSGFRLCRPPDTLIPWLAVRTMAEERLEGLSASADSLRVKPAFVLDLRGNGGGSDSPAMDWMMRLSAQPLRVMGSVQRSGRETDPLRAITSFAFGVWRPDPGMMPGLAIAPYDGKVAVLIDRGVASSGETMIQMAAQLSHATLIGENSAGCVSYGNVEAHGPLPNSRIRLHFGRSRFVLDVIRANPEGTGFFPDYWLDEPDPVATVSNWLAAGGR